MRRVASSPPDLGQPSAEQGRARARSRRLGTQRRSSSSTARCAASLLADGVPLRCAASRVASSSVIRPGGRARIHEELGMADLLRERREALRLSNTTIES